MFRSIFGILAALVVTSGTSPAATGFVDISVEQRVTNAQAKLHQLSQLAAPGEATGALQPGEEKVRLAQHWHNWPNWNNWRDHWNNWHNHHWGNHHRH